MYQKILVGVDNSDDAFRAVGRALEFQDEVNSEVVVFHSTKHHMIPKYFTLTAGLSFPSYTIPPVDYRNIEEEYKKAGEKILDKAKKMFSKSESKNEFRLVEDVEPDDYAINAVEKENFDLVILGCKGDHGKIEKMFGTIATKVVNEANCDVLVIR